MNRQSGARSPNGSRLPDDWRPSDADEAFATALGLDPHRIADSFRDYWLAQPGARGRKTDWPATWRNWCRRDAERRPGAAPKPSKMDWLVRDMLENP